LQHFIASIESALLPFTSNITPEGSNPEALVHQWMFAIAYEQHLFAGQRGVNKEKLINVLKENRLFQDVQSFKKSYSRQRSLNHRQSQNSHLSIYLQVSVV